MGLGPMDRNVQTNSVSPFNTSPTKIVKQKKTPSNKLKSGRKGRPKKLLDHVQAIPHKQKNYTSSMGKRKRVDLPPLAFRTIPNKLILAKAVSSKNPTTYGKARLRKRRLYMGYATSSNISSS